jgi:hypothetical protein
MQKRRSLVGNVVNRGWYGQHSIDRSGYGQRQIRRALQGYGEVLTTRELMQFVWPRLSLNTRQPRWRWYLVRRAAERYAERVTPRTRPLSWRAKTDL